MRPPAAPAGRGRADDLAEGPRRYWDPAFEAHVVKVLPGEHHVTADPGEMLVTVLGSCVAACVRDPIAGVGGMNHFMLPGEARPGSWHEASSELRYGQAAMERLINDILTRGGRRGRLEVKLFGGGNVLNTTSRIGSNNAAFAREWLRREGFAIAAEDLEGAHPRRVHYFPATGRAFRLELRRAADAEVAAREAGYREQLRRQRLEGSIELFE